MAEVSILILTHDAPKYVEETIVTLNEITLPEDLDMCEVVVLDNASGNETKDLLDELKGKGYIGRLFFSAENTFFARGNNLAAGMADKGSRYLLLLNSDVKIKDAHWLSKLIGYKEAGGYAAVAYGRCENPDRADGYCFLVDRAIYEKYGGMDENFQWWGGATKLQADILTGGGNILAIDNHDAVIHHYGGKSGRDFKRAAKLDSRYYDVLVNFKRSRGRVDIMDMVPRKSPAAFICKKFRKIVALIKKL